MNAHVKYHNGATLGDLLSDAVKKQSRADEIVSIMAEDSMTVGSEDVMDLDENQRVNLDVLLRCEDQDTETILAWRQAFLYE